MAEATATLPASRADDVVGWIRHRGVYVALGLLVLFNIAFSENFLTMGRCEST
jgi:hypothetical protein